MAIWRLADEVEQQRASLVVNLARLDRRAPAVAIVARFEIGARHHVVLMPLRDGLGLLEERPVEPRIGRLRLALLLGPARGHASIRLATPSPTSAGNTTDDLPLSVNSKQGETR